MNTPEDDREKSRRYLATRGLEPVCRETGAEAISGTCPVHKGDRCLVVRESYTSTKDKRVDRAE